MFGPAATAPPIPGRAEKRHSTPETPPESRPFGAAGPDARPVAPCLHTAEARAPPPGLGVRSRASLGGCLGGSFPFGSGRLRDRRQIGQLDARDLQSGVGLVGITDPQLVLANLQRAGEPRAG